ncbi:hypothetical protein ACWDSL_07270 [Streptomyces sp. NPDC000941]
MTGRPQALVRRDAFPHPTRSGRRLRPTARVGLSAMVEPSRDAAHPRAAGGRV